MAETPDPLSMSLDDIIKAKADKVQGERKASRRGRGAGGSGRANSSAAGRGPKTLRSAGGDRLTVMVSNAGIQKQRNQRKPLRAPMADVERDSAALHGSKPWAHDLYQDPGPARQRRQQGAGIPGTLLNLSNLDYKVSNEDIQELFATVGTVKKAGINFDSGDRPDGTAFVIFEKREDAAQAIKRYNNVALDGKPMKIELAKPGAGGSTRLSSGLSVGTGRATGNSVFQRALSDAQGTGGGYETGSRQQGGMRSDRMVGAGSRSSNVRRAGRGRGGVTRMARNDADLDADLDAYMQE